MPTATASPTTVVLRKSIGSVVTTLNHFGKGIWKLASILIGIIGGYIVALCFGMVVFSSVAQAAIFQLPKPMHFGIKFEPSSCVALGILFAINSVQAIGDFSATTTGSMNRNFHCWLLRPYN